MKATAVVLFRRAVESFGCASLRGKVKRAIVEPYRRSKVMSVQGSRATGSQPRIAARSPDRHADVIKVPTGQRRKTTAIDGRLGACGQLVKNSFQGCEFPRNHSNRESDEPNSWTTQSFCLSYLIDFAASVAVTPTSL